MNLVLHHHNHSKVDLMKQEYFQFSKIPIQKSSASFATWLQFFKPLTSIFRVSRTNLKVPSNVFLEPALFSAKSMARISRALADSRSWINMQFQRLKMQKKGSHTSAAVQIEQKAFFLSYVEIPSRLLAGVVWKQAKIPWSDFERRKK